MKALLHCRNPIPFVALSLSLLSCAGQQAPQGGPIDTDPPHIVSTFPANYTTRFFGERIILEFNEYVDQRSVEESIFISPSVGTPGFDWSGREVEIRFSEQLRRHTTYVVNIGTDVIDVRNRNKMARAFTLAFSTGDEIDQGAIEGRVYPIQSQDSPEGIMILAYNLTGVDPDTLDPTKAKPDYVTQTGKGGDFFFRHIALGEYRLLAIRDEYRNLLYDPEADDFGIPAATITLSSSDTLQLDVLMQLAREDTTAPRLVKATAPDLMHVVAEFSEPMNASSGQAQSFSIADTLDQSPVGVRSVSPLISKPGSFLLVTEGLKRGRGYRMTARNVTDLNRWEVSDLANSISFESASVRDTTGPALVSSSIPDSARGIQFQTEIEIHFSDVVNRGSAEGAILIQDSLRRFVPIRERWLSDVAMALRPVKPFLSKMWYSLKVDLRKLQDLSGNKGRDSARTLFFETLDAEALSAIEGDVVDQATIDTSGALHLLAENIDHNELKPYIVTLHHPGPFAFHEILEGRYVLRGFRDRNANGTYDGGRPFPFTPSERFIRSSDTLKVRARWPLEGVRLELR